MNHRNMLYIVLILLLSTIFASTGKSQEVIDSIAAVVDHEIILESEISYGISTLLLEAGIRYPTDEQLSEFRDQVLNAYITQKALLAKAEEETLRIEERMVQKEMDRKIAALVQQVGSEKKLEEYFGKPMRQIRHEMKEGVRDGMLIERLKQMHLMNVHVRRREVVDFYEEYKDQLPTEPEMVELSHILLQVEPSEAARQKALAKINRIKEALDSGANFDSLAVAESEDPSASEGGSLGFTERGDLVPAYEEAAFELEPGEISDIVKTRYGYHIIRLLERQGERISSQHILIQLTPSEEDWERVRAQAVEILDKIRSGESFAELARKYSDDEETADKGGALELMPVENLPDEFRVVLEDLSKGEVSEPFRTMFGIHLIRLDKKIEEHTISLAKDWKTIEMYATNQKREKVFNEWINELKKDHYISTD